jgi:hypothetical protein
VEEKFFHLHPEVLDDFRPPVYFGHKYGGGGGGHKDDGSRDDIAELFGRRNLASYSRFAVFSHAGGSTQLHKDAWDFGFWNTCVYGLKRWLIFPDMDDATAALIGGLHHQVRIDAHEWFSRVHPLLLQHNIPHFDFMQSDGDMVFVPGGWYHQVLHSTAFAWYCICTVLPLPVHCFLCPLLFSFIALFHITFRSLHRSSLIASFFVHCIVLRSLHRSSLIALFFVHCIVLCSSGNQPHQLFQREL